MFSLSAKKAMATALAGAAIASSLGASAARAESGNAPCVSPPPSRIAASAAKEYTQLREACASPVSTSQSVADESSVSGGFDAPSAAIGAAAGTGVVILLLAAGGLARGWLTRPQRHASA